MGSSPPQFSCLKLSQINSKVISPFHSCSVGPGETESAILTNELAL